MLKLFDTRTQRLEPFQPLGEQVTIYVCGITPYDTTHLGHAFTYTSADILIRYLEFQGYPVKYVQNVTDVDDDILGKAKEAHENWHELGNRWTAHFIYDMRILNARPPDYFPRATDMILPIIDAVKALLAAGVAYQSGGNVYFHVDAWPEFGQLSHMPRAEMLPVANERGNRPDDPHKRDPLDFVLWQAQAPGEPAWDSPWGLGRPGWHIECSTIVDFFLGKRIDIHGGGADLIFPHHECETAQVEAITGQKPFVRFWMHMAMVHHQGEKMSKSLGNLVMMRDLLHTWAPDTLRLYLGQHHYRQSWSHDEAELTQADQLAQKLYQAVTIAGGNDELLDPTPALLAFKTAMDNDLDTATALNALSILAEQVLSTAVQGQEVTAAQEALRQMGRVFGLRLDAPSAEARVMAGWEGHLQRFAELQKERSNHE